MNVLQDWLSNLTFRQQTVLIAAVRGPDGIDKYDFVRTLVRELRRVVLNDAAPGNGFMADEWPSWDKIEECFLKRPDAYPFHWLIHFMHAAEVIGYKHPTEAVEMRWRALYFDMCGMLHVNPETEAQMDIRLQDGGDRGCWKA